TFRNVLVYSLLTLQVSEWSLLGICLLLILLRFVIRFHARRTLLSWGDLFVFLAWVCFAGQVSLDTKLNEFNFFRPGIDPLSTDLSVLFPQVTVLKVSATYLKEESG